MTLSLALASEHNSDGLDRLYSTYLKHHKASKQAALRADIWTGTSEVVGVLADRVAPPIGIRLDAVGLLTKLGAWDASRVAAAEEAIAKLLLLISLRKIVKN